jgi:carbon-monoxide dehydrogenase small subunit
MEQLITLMVNGEKQRILVEPQRTLLEVIRDDLGLTGTKEGCGRGQCGACTVLLDGKAAVACLILAVDVQGREVTTIEGLSQGEALHPIQRAFVDHGAIQCGFCTPGMIMSAKALLDRNPSPQEEDIKSAIEGNFCRCTGYVKISKAIRAASNTPAAEDKEG